MHDIWLGVDYSIFVFVLHIIYDMKFIDDILIHVFICDKNPITYLCNLKFKK